MHMAQRQYSRAIPPLVDNAILYRLMLVENDPGDADLVRRTLQPYGNIHFDITWVRTLAEALHKLPLQPFDALLLDLVLPDSSGLETIHAIRQTTDRLPLVVLTGHDSIEHALQAINAGAQDYLIKGKFDTDSLNRAIRYAISRNLRDKQPLKLKHNETYQRLAAQIFDATADGIMVTDPAANIEAVNPAFCHITGYSEAEVLGKNARILKSDRHDSSFYKEMWETLRTNGEWAGEIWNRRKDGEVFPEWQTISSLRDETGRFSHYVAVFADMSGIHHARPSSEKPIWYDPLTGLANRTEFLRQTEQVLAEAHHEGCYAIVILFDIDRFKAVNQTHGLTVGNALLKLVAKVLRKSLHSDDLLARLDSDEFAILLPHLVRQREQAGKDALVVAEKLRLALQKKLVLNDESFHLDISIGIAIFPESPDETASDILRQADTAMHRAKTEGGSRTVFFEAAMGETIKEHYRVEHELRQAIMDGQLRLYVQPQWQGGTQLIGLEALVRWEHPERGMILPGMFISLAEASDLIVAIDRWVLDAVCRLLGRMNREGYDLRISVNISPRHFQQADFVENIARQLAAHGADPARLNLEVTEGLVIGDFADVVAKMTELRALGIHFSMDDFGTGYSSLAYLKRLPIHELKIDKSFIQDITTNPNDAALVESIIAVARHLHLQVVAEGVETRAQADFLNSHGNIIHQGYLYGHPQPVENWLAQHK